MVRLMANHPFGSGGTLRMRSTHYGSTTMPPHETPAVEQSRLHADHHLAKLDGQGRLPLRAPARALGWPPRSAIGLTVEDGILRVSDPRGAFIESEGVRANLDLRSRLQVPSGVRAVTGLLPAGRDHALRRPPASEAESARNPIIARLQADLADLAKRRRNVLDQTEEYEPSGDEEVDRDCRGELRQRLTDLAQEHKAKAQQPKALSAASPASEDDPTVLDQLPSTVGVDLTLVPEQLLRDLYDSFNLELRYHASERAVTIRVTVREDRVPDIRAAIDQATTAPPPPRSNGHHPPDDGSSAANRSPVFVPGAGVEPARPRRAREV